MSKEYDLYLKQHRDNVAKGFYWLREHLAELFSSYDGNELAKLEEQICHQHDASKDFPCEYDAYDNYFYSKNRSFEVVQDFNYAWLNHIHANPHHWQHYVLINDDPNEGEIVLDMEFAYIIEMICDWWAFSWNKGDLTEIFNWYDEHKDYMKLSTCTRRVVESILGKIREKLEESED